MRIRFLAVVFLLLITGSAFAQTTAALEGTVKGPDGAGLPGVTVSVKSPALMGVRLASRKLGNIPSRACIAQHCRTPGSSRPETWFYQS